MYSQANVREQDLVLMSPRQNRYRHALGRFINGTKSIRRRKGQSIGLARTMTLRDETDWLIDEYIDLRARWWPSSTRCIIETSQYAGSHPQVRRLQAVLDESSRDDLVGAYVHGSAGSDEQVSYSDLDVLLILSDGVLTDRSKLMSTARRFRSWKKYLYGYDPLQHHGWFVLTPFDLDHYCEAYFPLALFKYAKSLFPDKGRRLSVSVRDSQSELNDAFRQMAESIDRQLGRGRYPDDMYSLKSLLSRLMLMPALYLQARDGKGVWKGDSFTLAEADFSDADWHCIEVATEIRNSWRYHVSPVRRLLMTRADRLGSVARRRLSGRIPVDTARKLDRVFYQSVNDLVRQMRNRIALRDASAVQLAV